MKSLGATHVLDRNLSLPELSKKIHEKTKEPIKIVYDAISTDETQQAGYALLAEDGVLLTVDACLGEFTQEEQQEIKAVEAPTRRTVYVKGLVFDPDTSDLAAELYRRLPEMLKDGTIKVSDSNFCASPPNDLRFSQTEPRFFLADSTVLSVDLKHSRRGKCRE